MSKHVSEADTVGIIPPLVPPFSRNGDIDFSPGDLPVIGGTITTHTRDAIGRGRMAADSRRPVVA
jgi:dihydrodipicolinate synthase/N-acetylneuraminate lyase